MDYQILVLIPVLLGTVILGFWNVLRRLILKDKEISTLQLIIPLYWGVTVAFCAIYLVCWGLAAPRLLPGFWQAVLLGTLVNFFIQFLSAKAMSIKEGEISLVAPLAAMTPGLIMILAITLGEYPSRFGIAGILLMAAGSYLLSFEKTPEHWWGYLIPFRRLSLLPKLLIIKKLSLIERGKTVVVAICLATAILGAPGLLFDGLYTRRGINFQGLTLAMIVLGGLLALGYSVWYSIRPDTADKRRNGFGLSIYLARPKYLLFLGCLIIFWVAMIYLFQPAYNHTYVAYVGTLKRFSVLMTVIMSYFFFHESDFKKRLGATILIVLGVILISMDDLPAKISSQMQIWGM